MLKIIRNVFLAIIAVALIYLINPASAELQNSRLARNKVIAVIPRNVPPNYFQDNKTGKPAGFAIEVLDEIARRAGVTIEYRFGNDLAENLKTVRNGEADVIPLLGISEERKKYLDYTIPLEAFNISFFIRSQTSVINWSPENLTVGVVKEGIAFEYLKKRATIHSDLVTYNSIEHGLFDLLAGKLDAFAGPAPFIQKLAQESGIENRIKLIGQPIAEVKQAIAVKKGDTYLLGRLNKAAEGFAGSPEYRNIYLKWHGKPKPYWTVARIVSLSVFVALIIILVMALWRHLSILKLNRSLSENIAERKKAEDSLRKSEEKYRSLVESTDDSVYLVNRSYMYLYLNRKHMTRMGFSGDEYMGRAYSEFHSPEETRVFVDEIDKVFETGEPAQHEHRSQRDGKYFLRTLSPVKGPGAEIIAVNVVTKNITALKELEAEREKIIGELQSALEKIRALKGLIPICSWCKKVRDDKGYWDEIESYIRKHSDADFSHGICPECFEGFKAKVIQESGEDE
jgi:PAS domain S-box-containing protein